MGICIVMKTITGFLQRLLFINRKVLLAVKDGEDYGEESSIYTYGLSMNEILALATTIFYEVFNQGTDRLNLSKKAKVDMIIMIFKEISKQTGVDINITINERKK